MTHDLKRYKVAYEAGLVTLDRDSLHEFIIETFITGPSDRGLEPVGYFRGLILASTPVNEKSAEVLVADIDNNDLLQYPVPLATIQRVQEHFPPAEPVYLIGAQMEGRPRIQMIVEGDEELEDLFLLLYGPQEG
jgi:hypothetical protein